MGDLKTEDTSFPGALDTATLIADATDDIVAEHVNNPVAAILAIETELGVDVAGSVTDLATRLAVMLHADGGVLRGTSFPVSPPLKPHLFFRTDEEVWYGYDSVTAQYVEFADAATLADYLRKDVDETITAQHTFNPGSALPPFILHANAQGQKVVGLDAETVDGKNPGSASGLATLDGSSLVVQDPVNAVTTSTASKIVKRGAAGEVTGSQLISDVAIGTAPLVVTSTTNVSNLNADTVDGIHANATAMASMLFPLGANKELALPTPTSGTHTIDGVEIATVNSTVAAATDVTTNVNGHAITDILESDGVTAKVATVVRTYYYPGASLIASADTQRNTTETDYVVLKSISGFPHNGTVTVSFDLYNNAINPGSVAYVTGGSVHTQGTTWGTFTENIAVTTATTLSLYVHGAGLGDTASVRNFRVYAGFPVPTSITD